VIRSRFRPPQPGRQHAPREQGTASSPRANRAERAGHRLYPSMAQPSRRPAHRSGGSRRALHRGIEPSRGEPRANDHTATRSIPRSRRRKGRRSPGVAKDPLSARSPAPPSHLARITYRLSLQQCFANTIDFQDTARRRAVQLQARQQLNNAECAPFAMRPGSKERSARSRNDPAPATSSPRSVIWQKGADSDSSRADRASQAVHSPDPTRVTFVVDTDT
jgi:hypothetical protein